MVREMISVAEAVAAVTAGFEPLAPERVSLPEALGRVLAEDVAARINNPPAAVSAMDGYAVRAADVAEAPVTLTRVGESAAGGGYADVLGAGECVRIFTGAPLPEGADAIVIQEDTEVAGDQVTMREAATPGRWIRPTGLDFRKGDVLLTAGRVLTGRDLGLAAAMNLPWLAVRRRPRVAILATGDELVLPGEPMTASQIVSSNSIAVAAYVQAFGGEAINLGVARDNEESLRRMVAGSRGVDLLITIGGASVGDHDLVRKVLAEEGFALQFYRVAMRPGKPMIFGHLASVPVLGLPGNPVSAGVTALIFVKPVIGKMLGVPGSTDRAQTARLGRDLGANDHRQDYLRATLRTDASGEPVATPFEQQDSAMMAKLAEADCLVVRPPKAAPAKAGQWVEILRLDSGLLSL